MKKIIFLVSILLIGLLCNTKEIFCCGPFFESPVFTYNLNPDIPLDNFPKGNMGVILPSFARSYLYVAYRQLNGKGFSQDPRVPEALHLAVRSTRYGCTDDNTTKFSKQAFQLLHKNYPKSEWAAKTKYWF